MTDHEQIYPYVVNGLSSNEAGEVDKHLATCSACADELSDLLTVTAELSSAVAVSPPARMRSTVLAAIQGVPQVPSRSSSARLSVVGAPARAIPTSAKSTAPDVVPLPRRGIPARAPALLVAAAVIAALAFGGWAWHESQVAHTAASKAAAQTVALTHLLSSPDVKTASGPVASSGGSATLVLSRSRHEAVLVASGLPVLPDGKVYEAWVAVGKPRPAGTFTPEQATNPVSLPATALQAKQVMITVEPAGGSKVPTTQPIFSVRVPESA